MLNALRVNLTHGVPLVLGLLVSQSPCACPQESFLRLGLMHCLLGMHFCHNDV